MKLFCFDMDGTLLNSKQKVLESTKKALKIIHDNDDEIVVATGRHRLNVEEEAKEANIRYIVSTNGTSI
jgi:hydroxymethylpyrimidine pyrophosphatase-like HAD family hydrolase